jgi:hypothetical protein
MRAKSLTLLVLLALAACEKNEPKPESTRKEAKEPDAASKVEAIDPNLAEAVAAASVDKSNSAPPKVEGGPPPDGVFAPGEADKQIARGALPKVTLGSEGADPKILLGPGKGPSKLSGTVQIAMQQDPRQGAIPILLDVTFEAKKVEAAKDDKPVSLPVTVRVTSAKIDAPNVPKDLDTSIAKLKGSKVEYSIVPGGAGAGFRLDIPKGAPDEFKDVVRGLSESISMLTIPYPEKALGAGGYFMVTSRDEFLGLDLVTYRMIKVKEVTPEGATLDVSTKRYAATRSFDLPGLPPNIDKTLAEFQSASDGSVKYPLGGLLPTQGEISSVLAAQLGGKDVKQRAVLQFQTRTQLNLK